MPTLSPTDSGPTVLALDVSSTAVGFAAGPLGGAALDRFGVLRPRRASAPSPERIDDLVDEVRVLLASLSGPVVAVLEWSSGKAHGRTAGRAHGAGLAVLGQAQGQVRQVLSDARATGRVDGIDLVAENDWTGSRPKERRAIQVRLTYPAYAAFAAGRPGDPGLDAADAIGLLDWYRAREQTARLLAEAPGGPALGMALAPAPTPRRPKRRATG